METTEQKIIQNVIKIREKQQLTKRYVAEKIGISEANYGRIENRKTLLTIDRLAEIADALQISIIDIITYPDVYRKTERNVNSEQITMTFNISQDKKDMLLKLVTKTD